MDIIIVHAHSSEINLLQGGTSPLIKRGEGGGSGVHQPLDFVLDVPLCNGEGFESIDVKL